MIQEKILTILYDMALVIGGEDRLEPLLQHTLQRLIYHTSYPCGAVFLGHFEQSPHQETQSVFLAEAIGDWKLIQQKQSKIELPSEILFSENPRIHEEDLSRIFPLKEGRYQEALRLPIQDQGIIFLFFPKESRSPESAPEGTIPFDEIFKPILSNLSRAIHLCRINESYRRHLIEDRDQALADNRRFRAALNTSKDGIYLIDPDEMRFIDFNAAVEELTGYEKRELLELGPQDFLKEYSTIQLRTYFEELMTGKNKDGELISSHRHRNGSSFPVEIRLSVLDEKNGKPIVIAVVRDITERRKSEEALFREKERALVTLQSIGDGVITTDPQGHIEFLNPVAEALTGWRMDEAVGKVLNQIFSIMNETTGEKLINPVERCLREGRVIGLANHTVMVNRQGDSIAIEDSAAPIRDRTGEIIGVVMVFHNVTRARKMARQLAFQASHDSLTGLMNRYEFEHRLVKALQTVKADGDSHVLLYMDLDQFKIVNDTCGHLAGDELLKQIGRMLQSDVPDPDLVSRLGGDEFGILLEHHTLHDARGVAERLRTALNNYIFAWEKRIFEVGVSIGVVSIEEENCTLTQVMSAADVACYAAKDAGRNRIHVYAPNDAELRKRRGEMQWVSRITSALNENRFHLYYQAIIPLHSHDPEQWETGEEPDPHYEILLRLKDEGGVLILPENFLPAAERYNIMPLVDRWVIENTFRSYRDYYRQTGSGRAGIFSINLSGTSLNEEDLGDFIEERARFYEIRADRICFEVTETAAIYNLTRASIFMKRLKQSGFRFSLDDFGSGLSSFNYLKNLPVDYLKIDGSFVKGIADNRIDEAMVEAINHIGHVMGLKTIAEYAETERVMESLKMLGVDFAQGYAVHKPSPLHILTGS